MAQFPGACLIFEIYIIYTNVKLHRLLHIFYISGDRPQVVLSLKLDSQPI